MDEDEIAKLFYILIKKHYFIKKNRINPETVL